MAIEGLESDLSLEGEVGDFGKINVFHPCQLLDLLKGVLEGEFSILVHISKVLWQDGPVLANVLWVFVSEAETFVQLYLGHHVGGDDWLR